MVTRSISSICRRRAGSSIPSCATRARSSGTRCRAICGGGRYDNLLGSLGGVDLPALGFGMGDVVLLELLKARKLLPEFFVDLQSPDYVTPFSIFQ